MYRTPGLKGLKRFVDMLFIKTACRLFISGVYCTNKSVNVELGPKLFLHKQKAHAPGEDRTHDLQIALVFVIMRLTRCLLRYRGRLICIIVYYRP